MRRTIWVGWICHIRSPAYGRWLIRGQKSGLRYVLGIVTRARGAILQVSAELGTFCKLTNLSVFVDAPLFLTVSVTAAWRHNFHPGDTDPNVPRALQVPLDGWRKQAMRQETRNKVTVLINELEYQATKMEQGGRKAWWDTQRFQEIFLVGADYRCQRALGAEGSLQLRDCQRASYEFIRQGMSPLITKQAPLRFQSGKFISFLLFPAFFSLSSLSFCHCPEVVTSEQEQIAF